MDSGLRFKKHVETKSTKGLKAALAFKQMRALSSDTARQLLTAILAPVIEHASLIWMHSLGSATAKAIRQVQKLGSQAITSAFSSVAGAVAKAEAYILLVKARHWGKTLKKSVDLYTLPSRHPISRLSFRLRKRFQSPVQRISKELRRTHLLKLEKTEPYIIRPMGAKDYNR